MTTSKTDLIRKFIQQKRLSSTAEICEKFKLSVTSVSLYLKRIGALHSYNCRKKYFILPDENQFDEDGLLFIGDAGFFREGSLLSAICYLVEASEQGLGARELDEKLKTTTHSQLPKLYKNGRLTRSLAVNRPGKAYIYFSLDKEQSQMQRDKYFTPEAKAEETELQEEFTPDELPDVIEVLLTLISHPDFSAKSVALSLQRRGRKIALDFVSQAFNQYNLSKKNS